MSAKHDGIKVEMLEKSEGARAGSDVRRPKSRLSARSSSVPRFGDFDGIEDGQSWLNRLTMEWAYSPAAVVAVSLRRVHLDVMLSGEGDDGLADLLLRLVRLAGRVRVLAWGAERDVLRRHVRLAENRRDDLDGEFGVIESRAVDGEPSTLDVSFIALTGGALDVVMRVKGPTGRGRIGVHCVSGHDLSAAANFRSMFDTWWEELGTDPIPGPIVVEVKASSPKAIVGKRLESLDSGESSDGEMRSKAKLRSKMRQRKHVR